jgi:SatD family (SatD)
MRLLNRDFRRSILTKFVITLGDEFEGILHDSVAIPDLISRINTSFVDAPIRLGFGRGSLSTEVAKSPLEMDGEAFHNARAAMERARKEDLPGGVFLGYGFEGDQVLNGFARILSHHWSRLTKRQRETVSLRCAGLAQVQIAKRSGVSESAISQALRKSGWQAFAEAEQGFRAAFRLRESEEPGR